MAQIRFHNKEVIKEGRALVIIHATIHYDTFINILNLETKKKLGTSSSRSSKAVKRRRMKVLNV